MLTRQMVKLKLTIIEKRDLLYVTDNQKRDGNVY